MALKKIRCPKCGHEQHMGKECEACGVIYARYKLAQNRLQEEQVAKEEARKKQSGRMWSIVQSLVLVLLTAGGTYYYMNSNRQPAVAPVSSEKVAVAPEPAAESPTRVETAQRPLAPKNVVENVKNSGPMTIEEARQATVSIETPWGSGSGFFVSDNFIVTNRHVVQMDENLLVEFRHKVEKTRELVELEKQKIRDMRARLRETKHVPTRGQLEIIIGESERNLNTIMPQLEDAERRLAKLEEKLRPDDVKIILADGTSQVANFLLISDRHDLALMSIYVNDVKHLSRPPENSRIQQGDKVFTIGSPVGLRNTVTSGVFSGYRKDSKDGSLFLQTDAPINPGNSGGPLIDENGYVRGVNTMILQDTEGIGFAIPIDTVFEEFGSAIY
ncbi:S1C family serine protease [Desulfopila aestuarii]|uniref:Trypsin-like peptidase domain-containing protein n=1 Tax=Desulfopila aestuarii DSM 18488 TaxID=1121416 RepID=A0A1M7Y690_9BACT|nr:trypsin-like peptidase domain-containing protein [Desulfopila aestuarii]SHO47931.1 Trypsin-like peptidase domain-containing protein [Desulfopila aestuarii DSM 18488]